MPYVLAACDIVYQKLDSKPGPDQPEKEHADT